MITIHIEVTPVGIKRVRIPVSSLADQTESRGLMDAISVPLDLLNRAAQSFTPEPAPAAAVEIECEAERRIAELESANRQLQSFANELVRAVNDDEENEAPRPMTDADWFHNGYDLAFAGAMPHLRSPDLMWSGWAWGFLERTKHFPKIAKRKRRKG